MKLLAVITFSYKMVSLHRSNSCPIYQAAVILSNLGYVQKDMSNITPWNLGENVFIYHANERKIGLINSIGVYLVLEWNESYNALTTTNLDGAPASPYAGFIIPLNLLEEFIWDISSEDLSSDDDDYVEMSPEDFTTYSITNLKISAS